MRRLGAAVLMIALSLGATATARAEVVERVVAVVNDEAIFLSDLRRRAAPFLARIQQIPSPAQQMAAIQQLYSELLERMVQEELFIQAAEQLQVTVTRAEVDRAIQNVQRQSELGDADFWEAVRSQGFTPEQYRADVRRQLLRLKVLNHRARNRVNITEAQVRQRYEETVARSRRASRFNAEYVFIELPEDAGATELAAARARAEEIREGIQSAADFERAIAAVGGGQLGWLDQGALPPALEENLLGLDVGEIGAPVRGPSGFMIFHLLDRQAGSETVRPYAEVRMQIYGELMEQAMAEQEQIFLAELRRAAVVDVRL